MSEEGVGVVYVLRILDVENETETMFHSVYVSKIMEHIAFLLGEHYVLDIFDNDEDFVKAKGDGDGASEVARGKYALWTGHDEYSEKAKDVPVGQLRDRVIVFEYSEEKKDHVATYVMDIHRSISV